MMLFFVFTFIIAAFRGGKLSCVIGDFSLFPLFLCEIIYIFFIICTYFGEYRFIAFAQPLQAAFNLSLVFPILKHKLYKPSMVGCSLVIIGTLLNRAVIMANNGKMPVYPTLSHLTGYFKDGSLDGSIDTLHIAMTSSTKLNLLGDWLDTGFSVMSIGDVMIHLFVSIIIFYSIIRNTAKLQE